MMCYGLVGVVVGLLVGCVFLFIPQFKNVHAGSWGLVSFVFAACASVYGLMRWKCWVCLSPITMLFVVVGAGGTALGSVGFILYVVLGAVDAGEYHNRSCDLGVATHRISVVCSLLLFTECTHPIIYSRISANVFTELLNSILACMSLLCLAVCKIINKDFFLKKGGSISLVIIVSYIHREEYMW